SGVGPQASGRGQPRRVTVKRFRTRLETTQLDPDSPLRRKRVMDAVRTDMHRNGQEARLVVAGELDLASAPQLREALLAALDQAQPGRELVVDVSGVRFLDCTAVGTLVQLRARAEERGCPLRVAGAAGVVLEVLEIAGVAKGLDVYAELGPDQPVRLGPRASEPSGGAAPDRRPSDEVISSLLDAM